MVFLHFVAIDRVYQLRMRIWKDEIIISAWSRMHFLELSKSSALYSIELRAFEISAFKDVRCFDWSHNESLKWTSPVQFSELLLSSLRWWVKVNSSILWRYLGCYYGAFHITACLAAIWSIFLNAVEFGSSLQAKFIWKFDNFLVFLLPGCYSYFSI